MFKNKMLLVLGLLFLTSACTSTRHSESTGQYVDSSAITLKVKAALLKDPIIKSLPITVNSYKNTVQLSGFVENREQELRAVELTKQVSGVYTVKDDLLIQR